MMKNEIKVGSDFSGVGAFNQALKKLGIEYKEVFACDMDKYARKTFIANYGEPEYYPTNVYDREIPKDSLDIYMTSPPCQAFSLAGKRLGKDDLRGVLFFNSLEFIQENKPRFFIFENVKGLLSDDNGRTFQEWVNLLGGKSVNGLPILFPYEDSVPYHIYWTVLNAKDFNIPQNRERVFIVGIRDDADNVFQWPAEKPLTKKLKDCLESEVDEKYFLSDSNIEKLLIYNQRQIENNRGFSAKFRDVKVVETMDALKVGGGGKDDLIKVGTWRTHKDGQGFREIEDGNCPTIPARAREDGSGQPVICIPDNRVSVVKLKRTEEAKKKRSESLKKFGKDTGSMSDRQYELENQEHSDTILASPNPQKDGLVCVPVLTPDRVNKRQNGRRFKEDGEPSFTITTQDRHGVLIPDTRADGIYTEASKRFQRPPLKDLSRTLKANKHDAGVFNGYRIRRLTPVECFRLMDFPDSLVENAKTVQMSDSQLYKQAGNSICVGVLAGIINGLKKL